MRTGIDPEARLARRRARRSSARCSAIRRNAATDTLRTPSARAAAATAFQCSAGTLFRSGRFHEWTVSSGYPMASARADKLGNRESSSACVFAARLPPPLGGEPVRISVIIALCNLHSRSVKGMFPTGTRTIWG